jgi:hypothetical protein
MKKSDSVFYISNKLSEKQFEDIVYKWLIDGDYTPDDIIENIITDKNLLYLPVIHYQKKYTGFCNASLGYQRAEDYYEWDNVNKKQIRKTRYVTDWHPYSQNVAGATDVLVFAGDENLNVISSFIEDMGWGANDLVVLDSNAKKSENINSEFNLSIEEGWRLKGNKKSLEVAYIQTANQLPSKLVNNLNLNVDFSEINTRKVIVPYWLFNYEYKSKYYYVAVDGNSTERIYGTKPEDTKRKKKVANVRWAGWLTGIFLTAFTLYLLIDRDLDNLDFDLKSVGTGLGGLILTGIITETIVTHIKKSSKLTRERKLKEKTNQ